MVVVWGLLLGGPNTVNASRTPRHSVLIYYADETTEQAFKSLNYLSLLAALRSSDNPTARVVANELQTDSEQFPRLIRRDISDLTKVASTLGADLFVFSNTLALQGKYQFYSAETDSSSLADFPPISASHDVVLATSPLSRPDQFAAALGVVGRAYPPGTADAILIASSHGTMDMALMPRVSVDLSAVGPEEFLRRLALRQSGGVQPDWARLKGTTKVEFWHRLAVAQDKFGMRFPIVFREACQSAVTSWREALAIPSSVNAIAHSGLANIDPKVIDYIHMLDRTRRVSLPSRLESLLRGSGVHVDHRSAIWVWPTLVNLQSVHPALFFAPLLVWLSWRGALLAYRRSDRRPTGRWPLRSTRTSPLGSE
jgi:hypothetical protein